MTGGTAVIATSQLGQSDCGLAHIQERIKELQEQVEQIAMMTERKKVVLKALRMAVESFGYDLDAIMASKSRERNLVDIRSIVWTIYKDELGCSCMQMAPDFNWDRCTIYYCIRRSEGLRDYDRNFADMCCTGMSSTSSTPCSRAFRVLPPREPRF